MKKISIILIIFVTIVNSIIPITNSSNELKDFNVLYDSIYLSKLSIEDSNNYTKIKQENLTFFSKDPGRPEIPYIKKTYIFPLGTKINKININIKYNNKIKITKPLDNTPIPEPLNNLKLSIKNIDNTMNLFDDKSIYPSINYEYHFGIGLNKNKHVLYCNLIIYPIKYMPYDRIIYYSNLIDIKIEYFIPSNIVFPNIYDMVIITPHEFKDKLISLCEHKNNFGIRTYIITLEDIYNLITSARDEQEKIKLYIENAIEDFGIKYVLLVGGKISQRNSWYLPVRYSNLDDWSFFESSYISDLYYSDIFRYDAIYGYSFEDWDSNMNNIFGEWNNDSTIKDVLDLYPDVYIGRVACRNIIELNNIISKIIDYESNAYNQYWFNRMIVIAGDTFPNSKNDYEGEIETNLSSSYLKKIGFDVLKLYASDNSLKRQNDVIKAINNGAGFIHFAGHGNPSVWSTHPPNKNEWIDGLYTFAMVKLNNRFKLPICIVGGCHNSQINVSFYNYIYGLLNKGIYYFLGDDQNYGDYYRYEWVPRCWSWKLISCHNSGSIATIGNTGLGYGYPGEYTLQGLGGWIEPRFFYNYAEEKIDILGEVHSRTIIDYINNFNPNNYRTERKTIEQWILLGDPSLKIGGYP